jgi:hypothetical protein
MNSHPSRRVAAYYCLDIPGNGIEANFKVVTPSNICKPPDRCPGMYELGRQAAQLHMKHYGNELDLLAGLTKSLCRSCETDIYAGYFITKEEMANE